MKKQTSFVFAAAIALVGFSGIVSAEQGGSATSDTYAYCGGAGWVDTDGDSAGDLQLESSVDRKPDGVDGKLIFKAEAGGKIRAHVTCLTVDGADATMTGVIYSPDELAGQIVVGKVHDGDQDGTADAAIVAMGLDVYALETDVGCYETDLALAPLTQGNFETWGAW
jgi:hypothetical protein